jgi:Asp-tRNA(Asn)/Glu-tRNA(Gln) amidotransferase A subunit family amidase
MSARLGDLIATSPDLIDPPLLAAVKRFREMSVDTHARLARKQFEFRETVEQFFERYDILLTPAMECVAWDVEQALPPSRIFILSCVRSTLPDSRRLRCHAG